VFGKNVALSPQKVLIDQGLHNFAGSYLRSSSRSEREGKHKLAPLPGPFAFCPDFTALRFDQVPGNGQADTTAASVDSSARLIHAVEASEDVREVFCRDADAAVLYLYLRFSASSQESDIDLPCRCDRFCRGSLPRNGRPQPIS
jgi:hypothetical protein